MLRTRSRTRSGGLPWYRSTSLLLNGVSPTLIHDYANNRYARYESITNNITYSQDLTNVSWTYVGGSVTSSTGTDPFGGSTACLYTEDTSTGFHNLGKAMMGPPNIGDPLTLSCYFKPNGRTQFRIQIGSGIASGTNYATFDTAANTTTISGAVQYTSLDQVGNTGWWRGSVTILATSAGASASCPILLINGGSGSYTGDGVSGGYFWGVQMEYNARVETYVPTTSSTASAVYPLSPKTFPFTLTRTSNATMFDANGNLVWAPANEFLYSADLSNASWLLAGSATITSGQSNFNGMLDGFLYTEGGTGSLIRNASSVVGKNGSTRTFSAYLKYSNSQWLQFLMADSAGAGNGIRCWFDLLNGQIGSNNSYGTGWTYVASSMTPAGNGWYRCSLSVTVGSSAMFCFITTTANDGTTTRNNVGSGAGIGSSIYMSYFQLENYDANVPKTYNPTWSSAYYGPRFAYDPVTRRPLGIQSESSVTNNIPVGSYLQAAGTTANMCTASTGATYWGWMPSVNFTGDGTSGTRTCYFSSSSVSPGSSEFRTVSALVKNISGQYIQMNLSSAYSDTTMWADFDILNGSVSATGAGASDAFCVSVGNGIYHVGFSFTTIAGALSGVGAVFAPLVSGTEAKGDSTTATGSFDVISMMNYANPDRVISSLIPTFGSQSTRSEDTFRMGVGSWNSAGDYTVYVDMTIPTYNQIPVVGRYLWAINRDASNTVQVFGSSSGATHQSIVGGAGNSVTKTPIFVDGSRNKIVAVGNSGGKKVTYNGGIVSSNATAPYIGAGNVILSVGGKHTGATNTFNGYISEFRFYPSSSASDAQLQTLTT